MKPRHFPWTIFRTARPRRSSGGGPPGVMHRRLAVERIEDRLLLSVASGGTVDGGMLEFDCYSASGFTFVTDTTDSLSLGRSGSFALTSGLDSQIYLGGDLQPGGMESLEIVGAQGRAADVESTVASPTGPQIIGLTEDDLDPAPADRGMVDLARIAYDHILADADAADKTSRVAAGMAEQPNTSSLTGNLVPGAETVRHDRLSTPFAPLSGSRGRLVAFDLAMHPDGAGLRHAPASPETSASNGPAAATHSHAQADRAALEAFSGLRLDQAETPARPKAGSFGPILLVDRSVASPDVRPAQEPAQTGPAESATAPVSPVSVDALGAEPSVAVVGVSLGHWRQKTTAELAAVLGIGQILVGRHLRSTDDAEHEQLPPRRR